MQQRMSRLKRPFIQVGWAAILTVMMFCLWAIDAPSAWTQDKASDTDATAPSESIQMSLENVLATQRTSIEELQKLLSSLQGLQDTVQTELTTYQSQNTTLANLLLIPWPRIRDLEDAIVTNRLAIQVLNERMKTFQARQEAADLQLKQANERSTLAQKQMAELRESPLPDQQPKLFGYLKELLQVLNEKKLLLNRYHVICQDLIARMQVILTEKEQLREKLTVQLRRIKHVSLFKRSDYWQKITSIDFFLDTIRAFGRSLTAVSGPDHWKIQWYHIKMVGSTRWVMLGLVLTFIGVLGWRFSRLLKRVEKKGEERDWTYRCLGLRLLRRSLPLIGATLLFRIYSNPEVSTLSLSLGYCLYGFFLILLISRWGMDYLAYGIRGPAIVLRSFIDRRLKRLFQLFPVIGAVMYFIIWMTGFNSPLTWMARNFFATGLLVWTIAFWRALKPVIAEGARAGQAAPNPKWIKLLQGWSYVVLGATPLISMVGYDNLAGHWVSAWIETVALLFWGWISRNAIREWRRDHQEKVAAVDAEHHTESSHQLRWLLIQIARLLWFFSLVIGFILIWDPSDLVMTRLEYLFGLSMTFGKLKISIEGLIMAVVIIFLTYIIIKVGRTLIGEKILDKQRIERGLKDSILTIAGYLGWGIGLIVALGILGVNATSLAVVFGALSIGIGFGLQNIFNNFISGLILLFERPIQVGDYIEIGGLWAEVRKINVRATVVQTFDNAAVIIPNSDFISQKVTNWTLRDKRMRRNIEVGVAYGSDVERVQKTLLDIAQKTTQVLKYPRPEVIFLDHAGGALIFRLRVWIHIDDYFTISSQIRFEIDRRFREVGIEIAFPKRDLYIRSIPEKWKIQELNAEEG
jgi:small-conductance mechanosensitive channel